MDGSQPTKPDRPPEPGGAGDGARPGPGTTGGPERRYAR